MIVEGILVLHTLTPRSKVYNLKIQGKLVNGDRISHSILALYINMFDSSMSTTSPPFSTTDLQCKVSLNQIPLPPVAVTRAPDL